MRIKLKNYFLALCLSMINIAFIGAQNPEIRGTVSDTRGEPLSGVIVNKQGTAVSTTTDLEGKYRIGAQRGDILEFSLFGMKSKQITVNESGIIDVILEEEEFMLDETVVIGYGTAKKRDLTGSITSLEGTLVADKPSSNPLASIQGRVAGVQVVNTGRAGQDPEIRIRGTNSINGYEPLYIVDGLFTNNINYLNPADIESIEILKDASSLAIFGISGANGVIILTTKRAKEGQTIVNFNSTVGFKSITNKLPMANAAQFRELYNEQRTNQGVTPFDYTNWQADTDWQDELFQQGFLNNNNISISGSTGKNKFYAGIGYLTEEGNIKTEEMKRITINLNSEYEVNKNLRFGFQINGAKMNFPDAKGVSGVLKAAPIAPVHREYINPVTGVTEFLLSTMPNFQRSQSSNPVRDIEILGQHTIGDNYRLAGSIFGELKLLTHLTFKATLSYNFGYSDSRTFNPIIYEYNPDVAGDDKKVNINDRETVSQSKSQNSTFQQDYVLTYDNRFGNHGLTAMLGLTSNYKESSSLSGSRYQLIDAIYFSPEGNADKWWLSSIGSTSGESNGGSQWRRFTMSYLARALYNYDSRYLLNVSYRRDGSSVFKGVGNTWDNFYSVGVGWVVTGESFMEDVEQIDFLKIKSSYGVLGSENTGGSNYPTYPILTSSGSAVFGEDVIPGYTTEYMVQNLRWEKTFSFEAGFQAELFGNRLSIEPVYYDKLTKDIIVSLSSRTGAKNSLENLGEISNKGLELALSWSDKLHNGDFRYALGANLTTVKNEVVSLGRDELDAKYEEIGGSPAVRTLSGYPIAHFFGYKVEGVYQTWNDIKQSPKNTVYAVKPGDLKFADIDGDGEITVADRTVIGNPTPDLMYGYNFELGYKQIDLSIDLMGVYGNEIYRDWGNSTYAQLNYQERHLNRWHGKGTSNWEPILDPSRTVNTVSSSYFIEDGSFFRIRNIQISYSLGNRFLKKAHLQSLKLFANVQNLKTWSRNSGYTPEIGGSSLKFGVDSGGYPMPAVYTFGINLSF
ncbi:MAG: TonB-dependent receptor [Dysgonamonadaceae bacterium]|jgi:TonB-linked SusC/RagA family outer membrane protein|nr:TonB-dependent receptor [Dysgonamonadaceae bacterium]